MPALYYYDDLLTIKTTVPTLPGARIRFLYESYNEAGERVNTAETTLVFVNKATGNPVQPLPISCTASAGIFPAPQAASTIFVAVYDVFRFHLQRGMVDADGMQCCFDLHLDALDFIQAQATVDDQVCRQRIPGSTDGPEVYVVHVLTPSTLSAVPRAFSTVISAGTASRRHPETLPQQVQEV
jgi:hypothetical protein